MTAGDKTYGGLGVPLSGEFEIKQVTLGTDIMTITGATSQSGDFIVCRDVDGAEKFVVNAAGGFEVAGAFTNPPILDYAIATAIATTAPTTGLTTGQIFFYDAANVRTFAIAAGPGAIWRVAMTNN